MRQIPYFLLLALVLTVTTVLEFALYRTAFAQPEQRLTAQFSQEFGNPQYHHGGSAPSWIVITFDQPVAAFDSDTPSVAVEGGEVIYFTNITVDNADEGAQVFYLFLIEASGKGPITFALRPNQPCADGGICTASGTMLTDVPAPHVILGPIEVSFAAATLGASRGFPAYVTVRLSERPGREVTVPLVVSHGGGVNSADVSGIPDSLTFSPDQTRQIFQVELNDDGFQGEQGVVNISFGTRPLGVNVGTQARTRIVLRGDNVWHATMTVGLNDGALGYSTFTGTTAGALTDDDFVWRGITHTVNNVVLDEEGTISIDFTPGITEGLDSLYLVLGDLRLNLSDGQVNDRQFFWHEMAPDWAVGASVPLVLHSFNEGMEVRAMDGRGNHSGRLNWGRVDTTFLRKTTVSYADRISEIASNLPGARAVSNDLFAQTQPVPNSAGASDMVWQWGQFVDHDISLTPLAEPTEPMNIVVPAGDPIFDPNSTGEATLSFSRSAFGPTTGTSPDNPREQVNRISTFIDASHIYGSDVNRAGALRLHDGSGKLRTSADGQLLIYNRAGLENDGGDDRADLFLSGDIRVNEQVGLTAMHTLFVREHNRLAYEIAEEQPELNGEEIFQTARKRVGAMMQVITYNEFLPVLLGQDFIEDYDGYDPTVDPTISNEFAAAAFRVGHTMLPSNLLRVSASGQESLVPLTEAFFNPALVEDVGIAAFVLGMARQPAQEVDLVMANEVRNLLFQGHRESGTDLAALNIQRGRDHGIARYNTVRRGYGLPGSMTFADVSSDTEVQERLRQSYGSLNNLDLWVGGLAEDHAEGAMVGETFLTIISDQFQRLRDGDRFWYENDPHFADDPFLLAEVEGTTLAAIIRRNTTISDDDIPDDVFRIEADSP